MATTSGVLSDITLEAVKQWAHLEATQAYERQIGALEKANKDLGSFQSGIDVRIKELQDERIPKSDQSALFNEAVNFVGTYDRLHIEALKAQKLAGELSQVIEYLTPKEIVDEASMKKRGGDLAESSKRTDEICRSYIQSLKDCQAKVDILQRKMLEQIVFKTTPAVQSLGAIINRIKIASNSWSDTLSSWSGSLSSWFVSEEEKPVPFTKVGDQLDDFRAETSLLNVAGAEPIFGRHLLVDITLEVMKQEVFNVVTQAYQRQIGKIEEANQELGGFERDVNTLGHSLQNGLITIPSQKSLYEKRVEFVKEYDRLYIEAVKAQKFAGELQRIIELVSPRVIINEATMRAHGGQLAKVSDLTDVTCRGYLTSLRGYQATVDTLQKQMVRQILDSTAWSLQRFCQIVDNEGKPLDLFTLAKNKCTWAVVPELADVQAKLEALSVEKVDNTVHQSTPSNPARDSEERTSPTVLALNRITAFDGDDLKLPDVPTNLPDQQGFQPMSNALNYQGQMPSGASDGYDTGLPDVSEDLGNKQGVETENKETSGLSDGYDTGTPETTGVVVTQVPQPVQLPPSNGEGGIFLPHGQVSLSPVL